MLTNCQCDKPVGRLALLWPTIRTVIADAGHDSRKLARQLRRDGWSLQIVKRKQQAFKVAGLTWIVERSFAWLGSIAACRKIMSAKHQKHCWASLPFA